MDFLTDKTIQVFDQDNLKEGYFITYCYTACGDEGEREEGPHLNGIISMVHEDKLHITRLGRVNAVIELEAIIKDDLWILGVKKNAI